jgi:L-fuconolactonase
MARIDAHQHFWKFDPIRDSWITDDMAVIQRDFFPVNLEPVLKANGIDGSVIVQSDQSEAENLFQLANSKGNDFIKGIVGWVNLQAPNAEERLAYYQQYKIIKGFRHVLQGEPNRSLMLTPAFKNGVALLSKFGYTYDILIYPDQLAYTVDFVTQFPQQLFIIDHIAKPGIKDKNISDWKMQMQKFAGLENVYCKISGMVTEADWKQWTVADFKPYLDVIVETFGTKRIVFGSDWPVCLVAGSYEAMLSIVTQYFSSFSKHEQELFFGNNAIAFYNLS